MKKFIIIILALGTVYASAGISIAQAPARTLNEFTIPELVEHFASQYQVSAPKMLATMNCESSLNPDAVGDHDTSFGIAQIHLPAHPGITEAEAEDPVFATQFMAEQWAAGNAQAWSCARILHYVE